MIKTIKTLLAVAALSGTVGANVQAAEITVQKGDTLWNLSQVHNTSVENLKNWNKLTTDVIHPGDVLTVQEESHYTVKQGDTLWAIAENYNVTVAQLKEWNRLHSDLIRPGLNLVILDHKVANNLTSQSERKTESAISTSANTQSRAEVQTVPAVAPSQSEVKAQSKTVQPIPVNNQISSKEMTVKATAYTASCAGCSGVTATGVNLKANPDAKVISVDPSVIPLGSKVYVEGYGVATAADTGGSIKGNRIDVFISSKQDAINWGTKEVKVKILN
ncbi:LysM peptidoglycan-binding domain-containing protein [Neobacillus sp. SM06]|uniref:3D domain-containing protein n=1 Tax=Neobacillus sp. SM06 TaxID=3422492 RepID=UPI003D2BBCEC